MDAHITGSELKKSSSAKTIELGGKEYEIALDLNAICELEERYGSFDKAAKVLDGIGQDFKKPGAMHDIRFLLCTMLHHTDESLTERQVGKLMTMSEMQNIIDSLGEAMHNSAPQADDDEKNVKIPQEK
ncbi:MAG TPA: hypothetical protein VHP31_11955 [Caproicibacter sp.]|nr:hypothetical protein [Caproicibacter sp.]